MNKTSRALIGHIKCVGAHDFVNNPELLMIHFNSLRALSRKTLNSQKTLYIVVELEADPKIMGLILNGKHFVINLYINFYT